MFLSSPDQKLFEFEVAQGLYKHPVVHDTVFLGIYLPYLQIKESMIFEKYLLNRYKFLGKILRIEFYLRHRNYKIQIITTAPIYLLVIQK